MRRQFAILCATILTLIPLTLAPVRAATSVNTPAIGGLPSGGYSFGNRQNGEIVSKRTRTSRTFAENGHYVTTVYQDSVNYQDGQGNWQSIDNTLTPATRSGYAYQNKANRYTADFPSDLGSALIHVEMGGSSLDFSLVGASGTGSISGNTDTFTIPGAAIAFTAGNDLLKENLTLSGPTSPSTFVYNVAMSAGLTARQNADGSFTSPTGADSTLVQNGDGTFTMTFHAGGEKYTFSSGGYFLSDVDRSGNKLSFGYDGSNRLSSITDTQGRLTTFQYNASGLITQMTDPASRTYGYGYDGSNNLVSYTDPAGKVAQFVYDVNHNLTQITDPVGNVSKLVYDVNSGVTSITYVTNPSTGAEYTTSFTYNSGNTVVTDPNGHASTYTFDTTDRVTSTKDPLAYVRQLTWTADSHISQAKQPSGATTTASFDANNNPTQTTAPTGAATKAQYGNSSLPYSPTSVTDTAANTSTIQYTANGLPSSATDPQNHTASASYNGNGTVASQTDENGNVTSYSYFTSGTSIGLLSQVTPPTSLGATSYTYNSYNQEATETDGKGQLSSYGYDSMGRLTSIGYADGRSIGYAYDADGNVLAMTDARGTTAYNYDALNRLTQETPPSGGATSYTYDGVDSLLSKTDSSGTISYTYTADDQLASVKDQYNHTTTYSYDQDGNETQVAYANGAKQTFSYDSAGEPTALTALSSTGATLASMSWSYTNPTTHQVTGMVYSKTDVAGNTTSNTYDSVNQLTSASTKNGAGTTLHSYSYTYDPAGNLLSKTMDGTTTSMTYNAANELTQAGTKTLSYDLNGSRTGDSTGASYTYNAAGQMATLTPAGGATMSMTYAGPGMDQRVAAGSKAYQYDRAGMKQFNYGTGTSQIVMTPKAMPVGYHTGGNTYYYVVDADGSVVAIYSPDGLSLQNVVIYTPMGEVIDGSQYGPANALGWQMLDISDGSGTGTGGGCTYDPATGAEIVCPQTPQTEIGQQSGSTAGGGFYSTEEWPYVIYNNQVRFTLKMTVVWDDYLVSVMYYIGTNVEVNWNDCAPENDKHRVACGVNFTYWDLIDLTYVCVWLRLIAVTEGDKITWEHRPHLEGAPTPSDRESCWR